MSPLWRLEFWGDSNIFGKFVQPLSQCHKPIFDDRNRKFDTEHLTSVFEQSPVVRLNTPTIWWKLAKLATCLTTIKLRFKIYTQTICVNWLITLGAGGGANLPWVLGTSFYKGVKFDQGENWFHKTHVLHFLFSVHFLLAIIQFSNQINYT
jgi:hypothetical protein